MFQITCYACLHNLYWFGFYKQSLFNLFLDAYRCFVTFFKYSFFMELRVVCTYEIWKQWLHIQKDIYEYSTFITKLHVVWHFWSSCSNLSNRKMKKKRQYFFPIVDSLNNFDRKNHSTRFSVPKTKRPFCFRTKRILFRFFKMADKQIP